MGSCPVIVITLPRWLYYLLQLFAGDRILISLVLDGFWAQPWEAALAVPRTPGVGEEVLYETAQTGMLVVSLSKEIFRMFDTRRNREKVVFLVFLVSFRSHKKFEQRPDCVSLRGLIQNFWRASQSVSYGSLLPPPATGLELLSDPALVGDLPSQR